MIKNETNAHAINEIATTFIEPSLRLFSKSDVTKVKANCDAPNRADAVPDSALNGAKANVVLVGNSIPKGNTKKNNGTNCM